MTDARISIASAFGAPSGRPHSQRIPGWLLCCLGVAAALAAAAVRSAAARQAAAQDWSPFVLVAGLLLIGLVADDDGMFAAAGYHLARLSRRGSVLFAGAVVMIGVVCVNNLPAASLLAARPPAHPFALLIGLNLGPNLFVTGSLAWLLWLRAARAAGARPSVAIAARLGALSVPLAMAAALAALALAGSI